MTAVDGNNLHTGSDSGFCSNHFRKDIDNGTLFSQLQTDGVGDVHIAQNLFAGPLSFRRPVRIGQSIATGLDSAFGEAARRRPFRRYGNALFGRGRLGDVEVIGLPRPSAGEPRVAILATLEPEGPKVDGQSPPAAPVSVAATHLSFRKGEGPVQLEALLEALGRRPLPRVLLGDLNLGPEAVESALAAAGYVVAPTAATFPVDQPRSRIDFIAVAGLEVVSAEAVPTPLSDHRLVVAEVGPDPS